MLNVIMLNFIKVGVIMLSVILLTVVMLSVVMLSVVMLCVFMRGVVAPTKLAILFFKNLPSCSYKISVETNAYSAFQN